MRQLVDDSPKAQVRQEDRGPARRKAVPRGTREHPKELRELKDRFIAWLIATRYADASVQGAHADLEWFYRYLGMRGITRIADVTPELLEDYSLWLRERRRQKDGQALSIYHIFHRLNGVKQYFKWLHGQMIVLCDPAEDLDIPRLPHNLPHTILTQDEAKKLLDAPNLGSPVGYRDKALLELVYSTGIRTGELFRLRVQDLDFKNRTVFVREGKPRKDRVIPLPAVSAGYVREYVEKVRPRFAKRMRGGDDGTLFLNWTGAKLDRSRVGEIFKRTTKAAGLEKHVTPMVLRHSLASSLLENGMDVRYIQEILGHSKLSSTAGYAHTTLAGLRKQFNKHHPKERRAGGSKDLKTDANSEEKG